MPRLPLPVRVAAGLAATAADEVRSLPSTVISLPVTAVSQVLQNFMRAQQHLTALAIRGDEVLSFLTLGEEAPEWATFDEDETASGVPVATPPPARPGRSGRFALYSQVPEGLDEPEPALVVVEEPAVGREPVDTIAKVDDTPTPATARELSEVAAQIPPAPLPGYDAMTLAQLRARLRTLSRAELEALLRHEEAGQARASFLTMLTNRIARVSSS